MTPELECCYRDCLCENQKLEIDESVREGEAFACPCGHKRLLVAYEIEGRRRLFPFGQRYHPLTGQAFTHHPPVLSQFRGESRGGLGSWESHVAGLPDAAYEPFPVSPAPGSALFHNDILQVPPPAIGGRYLVHRALDAEQWYFWSLATGKLAHQISGGEGLNLAAAPLGEISGIGLLAKPTEFHQYFVLPDLDPNPLTIKLPSPACPNAAPLMTATSRTGEDTYEARRIFIAAETGLHGFDFNECPAPGPAAHFQEYQSWTGDPRLFWSPVFFPGAEERGAGAVVTFHANGWAYVTWLDGRGVPTGADAIRIAEGDGQVLLPPAVTRDGLWCLAASPRSARIGLISKPELLRNPPDWQNAGWFPGNMDPEGRIPAETWAWTPLVADSRGRTSRGAPISRVVYLNSRELVFLDRSRLKLDRGSRYPTIHPHPLPEGFKAGAAFARARGEHIFLFDILTGRVCLFDARNRSFTEYNALSPAVLSNLLGGPAWCGDSMIWPARTGLHKIKIHTNHGVATG